MSFENVRFGFVILHYLVDEATERCISSIRSSCKGYNYAIVVVDNNSSNGSYGSLLSKYGKDNDIIFIHNENNMGFARGNNIGYEYCRNKLKCDYIVTINNDARIIDDNIIPKVVADYERTGCGVIGPHILSEKTHKSQNPIYYICDTEERVKKMQHYISVHLPLLYLHIDTPVTRIKRVAYSLLRKQNIPFEQMTKDEEYKLHGSCLIFTPAFLRIFSEPFDSRTFLYLEEDILFLRCKKNGLTMLYDLDIAVVHEEDVSTDYQVKNDARMKRIRYLKNQQKSLNVLSEYINK